MAAKLRVTLVKSLVSRPQVERATARSLGVGRIGRTAVHEDTPVLRGMIRRVRHLLRVEPDQGCREK
jgi:large subunit ribosomal protein L30